MLGAPLPSRLRPHGRAAFVDREAERAVLRDALDGARAGERRSVFITGEAGIGKTRLVSEVASEAHVAGTVVLAGRCDEGLQLAYQPFVEALEHLVAHAPEALLRDHVRAYGDTVARIVPALALRAGAAPTLSPAATEAHRYVMFAAIEELLEAGAGESALLVVLEDLHWADVPTVRLLRRLVTSPHATPIALVCTARPDLPKNHPFRQLLTDLHREPSVSRLDVGGLAKDDVAALVETVAARPPQSSARRFAEALEEATGGNPFYITELLQSLSESGELSLDGEIPRSISETLLRRVEHLGPAALRCLSAAAVIGDEFDFPLLLAVTEAEDVTESLDRAAEAGLLLETGPEGPRFRFVHALVRRCMYGELGPAKRADLHHHVALELERRLGGGEVSAAELARHWLAAAGTTDSEKPFRYSVLAGDEALAKLAPDEARRWYAIALEHLPSPGDSGEGQRCELLIKRGEAERQAGRLEFRETLLEAAGLAERAGDGERLVRAALLNTRGLQSATGAVDTERIAVLDSALRAVGEIDSAERAGLLAIQAAELTFADRARCAALSDEALAIARRIDDPAALVNVLNLRFVTIWTPETHGERLSNTVEAIDACDRLDDPLARFHAYHWRGVACVEAGEIAEARRLVALERELADRLRQPTTVWLATGDQADLAHIEGRLADAEGLINAAFDAGRESEPDAIACYTAQLIALALDRGTLGELVPAIEEAVRANPGIPGFRATLALGLCAAARPDEARRLVAAEAASDFRELAYDATWLSVACIFADVCARTADVGAAAKLYELLEPWSGLVAYPGWGVWGPVSQYLGLLAATLEDRAAAERHLGAAVDLAERVRAPIWAERSRAALERLSSERVG